MIKNKQIAASFLLVISANFSVAQDLIKYKPSESPLIKIAKPKPNLYISMSNDTNIANDNLTDKLMTVPEHQFGPGDPVCEKRVGDLATQWNALKATYSNVGKEGGYYDPFATGAYKPYLREEMTDEEYDKYIGAIPVDICRRDVYPARLYTQMFPEIIEKYSKRAYIGYGGYGSTSLSRYRSWTFNNGTVEHQRDEGGTPKTIVQKEHSAKLVITMMHLSIASIKQRAILLKQERQMTIEK